MDIRCGGRNSRDNAVPSGACRRALKCGGNNFVRRNCLEVDEHVDICETFTMTQPHVLTSCALCTSEENTTHTSSLRGIRTTGLNVLTDFAVKNSILAERNAGDVQLVTIQISKRAERTHHFHVDLSLPG